MVAVLDAEHVAFLEGANVSAQLGGHSVVKPVGRGEDMIASILPAAQVRVTIDIFDLGPF